MTDDPLRTPVQFVRTVGPQRAELLARLEITTAEDLLFTLPRDVLDLTDVRSPAALKEKEFASVRGTVVDRDARSLSGNRTLTAFLLDCGSDYVRGLWFNQPWILQKYEPGQTLLFSGKPKRKSGRWEFSHPQVQVLDEDSGDDGGVLPRYGLTEGLKMHVMRRMVRAAVEDYADQVPDYLPERFRTRNELPSIATALRYLHTPASMEQYEAGRRRVIFDDLLEFQLALAMRRRFWKIGEQAPRLPVTARIDSRIRRLFPFEFTQGQDAAVKEIAGDLSSGVAMHRLLQADVGAGKTAVAIYAMLVAIAAKYQAVLMAPTEVLAQQHWATIETALQHSRVSRALLTGSLTAAARRRALEEIRSGELHLVVGTQAVIQQDVEFSRLGVAVIDEQHKFGVMQRAHFSAGESTPHVLVMTATPIPRSLCLTQFGDLDITTIRELPPGRQRIVTSRVPAGPSRNRAWDFIRKQLRAGRQAYVVCPRIEATATGDSGFSAEDVYRNLAAGELRDFRVGLVHGQLDRDSKAAAMQAFRDGETQVLVSTTVIEVGVDVPNANVMVIYEAERFGLSQLHQLRGRIGRGRNQSYCFLFSESDSPEAGRRLHAMESTSDGFEIAEADFELRGPGDILGTRQHGNLPLRVADLIRDEKLLHEARKAAFPLVESGEFDAPEFAPLKVRVLDRFHHLMDLPQTG